MKSSGRESINASTRDREPLQIGVVSPIGFDHWFQGGSDEGGKQVLVGVLLVVLILTGAGSILSA
jgi:hypothetical protein